jgi:hypothetical protein
MPTKRDKRLFHLCELLADELNKTKGDVQPEDILSFMQCNVPISEDESSEEYEDMSREHSQTIAGRGTSVIARLRKSLGFVDGDSIISVMEKAAEVCEAALVAPAQDTTFPKFYRGFRWQEHDLCMRFDSREKQGVLIQSDGRVFPMSETLEDAQDAMKRGSWYELSEAYVMDKLKADR